MSVSSPSLPQAHTDLGIAQRLLQTGQTAEAAERFAAACEATPDALASWVGWARASLLLGQAEPACAALEQAIVLQPDLPALYDALAAARLRGFDPAGAVEILECAKSLFPRRVQTWANLGVALSRAQRVEASVECHRHAVQSSPHQGYLHRNLGMELLRQADWAEGWRHFEGRLAADGSPYAEQELEQPLWQGEALNGKSILLFQEQGLGDAIQFARFVPSVAELGARVVLGVAPQLAGLFGRVEGVHDVVSSIARNSTGEIDYQCPMMSLPSRLNLEAARLGPVPYLCAQPERVSALRRAVPELADASRLRVGVVWSGSRAHALDYARSVAPDLLQPLFDTTPGRPESSRPRFFNLQVEGGDTQFGLPALIPLAQHLQNFDDTAAALTCLDLTICVDTSVAHLAGALGRPTWLLLPTYADWRWQIERLDTPWYPQTRLFRQHSAGDWRAVIAGVAEALTELCSFR